MAQPANGEQASAQRRTTIVSIAAAGLLVTLKLGVGLITGSLALVPRGSSQAGMSWQRS
jgi:divalent metal cation (Fe/Co/Zn/Cd) transporter